MRGTARLAVIVVVLAIMSTSTALSSTIGFDPAMQTVSGPSVSVDVVISGLVAGGPPSVGSFDLDVTFDPTVLSPSGVIFGPFLGDSLDTFTFLPGVVDFAATSLLPPPDLDALQPTAFALATLSFDTLAAGTSPLVFSQPAVFDAFGATLPVTLDTASVTKTPVPEPGAFALVATALVLRALASAAWRRARARRSSATPRGRP